MLDYNFVAFIDVLGYSSMVKSDLEGPKGEEKYFNKLLTIHKQTASLKYDHLEFNIIQFSDSVIIATRFELGLINEFLKVVSDYQFGLLKSGILTRGGITFGKHYYKDNFLFSSALIDAYNIETKLAKYPRIVISKDLIDLVKSKVNYVIKDNNFWIIDFLENKEITLDEQKFLIDLAENLIANHTDTISEKGLWLKEFLSFKLSLSTVEYRRFIK